MDVIQSLASKDRTPISCIEMHTTGEPTRIVISGHPELSGTLLEQRAQARRDYDHIRRRLILEPRGHFDMYGALLRPRTELTDSGEADIGVLFLTNSEYSTMCGHATIALGRLLLDTQDQTVFPNRSKVRYDHETNTALLRLHAPCGLIHVTVPMNHDGSKSDPTKPVSFIDVPSFATGIQIQVHIPHHRQWPELRGRSHVTVDFSYGGAFYCFISATELGFAAGLGKGEIHFAATNVATRNLKAAINETEDLRYVFTHPDHDDLTFLYSVIIVDDTVGVKSASSTGVETGLCYFSDQQIDRSPTGSAVAARCALAYAKGTRKIGQTWDYHSLVSNAWGGGGSFAGTVVEDLDEKVNGMPVVNVQVSGHASYTGFSTFVVEKQDPLGDDGFVLEQLEVP